MVGGAPVAGISGSVCSAQAVVIGSRVQQHSQSASAKRRDKEFGAAKKQPRWIEVETNEPIYSVLGSRVSCESISDRSNNNNENDYDNNNSRISYSSAKKSATARQRFPSCPRKPPIPPNYRRSAFKDQAIPEAIYSVVNKQKGGKISPGEVVAATTSNGRREELENWLRTASRERSAMYSGRGGDSRDREWRRESNDKPCIPIPRGIVGLVGPYRIHQNPDEDQRRRYILEEEELVEDIVDSVSEVAARERSEHLRCNDYERPKWRIVDEHNNDDDEDDEEIDEDDNETIVPENDISSAPIVTEEKTKNDEVKVMESKPSSLRDNWKLRESAKMLGAVKYGKEERAVDVPDGASAVSSTTTTFSSTKCQDKAKATAAGKKTLYFLRQQPVF